jgi:hypothetical protein
MCSAASVPCIISTHPGGRATSRSARGEFSAKAISIPKSKSTAMSPRARSTPICGRPSKPKARFIQQVMSGQTLVRTAEDLEGGALTYAEIKAIASGNPAVMEKVKIDTEIRKLDQLRAVHLNQQHSTRWQLRNLPEKIEDARETIEHLHADIATRDAHEGGEVTMTVGKQVFSGKGAREEAGWALVHTILSRRDDHAPRLRASFRGSEILSRDRPGAPVPDLFVRGAGTYAAHINADNPTGTIQSIERGRGAPGDFVNPGWPTLII